MSVLPGDIVIVNPDSTLNFQPKIQAGVGVFIGYAAGFEWFHDGESLGDTGSAMHPDDVLHIGHDDDVNYARTIAATRSGRGSGYRSEGIALSDSEALNLSGKATTPEETSGAVSGDSVDSHDPFPVASPVVITEDGWEHGSVGKIGTVLDCPGHPGVLRVDVPGEPNLDDGSRGWAYFPWQVRKAVVYVSGPMTGYPEYNFSAFNEASDALREEGWGVINPADKGVIDGWSWADYLRYDLTEIAKADAIYTLDGWRESKGARLEMHIARELGITWLNDDGKGFDLDSAKSARAVISSATGEVRQVSSTGGEKGSKPERYDLVPWDAMDAVTRVYAFGAEKYNDDNWRRGYDIRLSIAAAFRHMRAYALGEDYDPESGEPHPAHAVFHMLALLSWMQDPERYGEFDTRTKVGVPLSVRSDTMIRNTVDHTTEESP